MEEGRKVVSGRGEAVFQGGVIKVPLSIFSDEIDFEWIRIFSIFPWNSGDIGWIILPADDNEVARP